MKLWMMVGYLDKLSACGLEVTACVAVSDKTFHGFGLGNFSKQNESSSLLCSPFVFQYSFNFSSKEG